MFYHYSKEPFTLDIYRQYNQKSHSLKPKGLWVSHYNSWEDWCNGADFSLDKLEHKTRIEFDDELMIHLDSYEKVMKFNEKYGSFEQFQYYIDWVQLSHIYTGIIISPYLLDARFDPSSLWYYGWDVASACIWEPAIITKVEPVVDRWKESNETRI